MTQLAAEQLFKTNAWHIQKLMASDWRRTMLFFPILLQYQSATTLPFINQLETVIRVVCANEA